jgi:hypothetical protein
MLYPQATLFDLGGTAKSRNFAHVRGHRRPVHRSLALGVSQVHHDLQTSHFIVVELVELRGREPENERALPRFYLDLFVPLFHLQPNRRGAGAQKRMESPPG